MTVRHASRLEAGDVAGTGLAVVQLPEREPVAVTAALVGAALTAVTPASLVLHGRSADVARVLELLPRHGARLAVEARARSRAHGAVRASCATPPG
jgi:hypothetical protein